MKPLTNKEINKITKTKMTINHFKEIANFECFPEGLIYQKWDLRIVYSEGKNYFYNNFLGKWKEITREKFESLLN